MQQADYRFWQVDHLQLSTTPPRSFPHNPNTVFNWDMTDFRVKGESLRWDFITPTTWHSDCLGFPFELPFVLLLRQNIVVQSHSGNGWLSVYSVWDLLGLGGCLFAQIAIFTRGCCCIPSGGALLIRHFQNPEGRHVHSDLPRWAASHLPA